MGSAIVAPSQVNWAFLFYLLINSQGVLSLDVFFPFFLPDLNTVEVGRSMHSAHGSKA
jgi:hypothetical protein